MAPDYKGRQLLSKMYKQDKKYFKNGQTSLKDAECS